MMDGGCMSDAVQPAVLGRNNSGCNLMTREGFPP